jgi:hypothetical protein
MSDGRPLFSAEYCVQCHSVRCVHALQRKFDKAYRELGEKIGREIIWPKPPTLPK